MVKMLIKKGFELGAKLKDQIPDDSHNGTDDGTGSNEGFGIVVSSRFGGGRRIIGTGVLTNFTTTVSLRVAFVAFLARRRFCAGRGGDFLATTSDGIAIVAIFTGGYSGCSRKIFTTISLRI